MSVAASAQDRARPLWSESITGRSIEVQRDSCVIGVLPGEGIGSEVIAAARTVLVALEAATDLRVTTREGPEIGLAASCGPATPPGRCRGFCRSLFEQAGALLCGPARGRFVYELRRRFGLFCKISPLVPDPELLGAIRLKAEHLEGVDVLIVARAAEVSTRDVGREEGSSGPPAGLAVLLLRGVPGAADPRGGRSAGEPPPRRGLGRDQGRGHAGDQRPLARAGGRGRGRSRRRALLRRCRPGCLSTAPGTAALDVVVAPNLFGDVLSDAGAVLLGSRGLSFGGSFASEGAAVYQTNHGAAMDLAGRTPRTPAARSCPWRCCCARASAATARPR